MDDNDDEYDIHGSETPDTFDTPETHDDPGIEMKYYRSFRQRVSDKVRGTFRRRERPPENHRGFTTSMADMFRYPDQERIDCCSITCCGCLQADRNRYIVTGVPPPGLCHRIVVHVMVPMFYFGIALFVAFNVPDPWLNEILCYLWLFLCLFYVYSQCEKGGWKRRDVRRNLLWVKQQRRASGRFQRRGHSEDSDRESEAAAEEFLGQSNADINCAHALCGCYAADRHRDFQYDPEEEITCCYKPFDCFTKVCCATLCCRYVVCCGFCALAQEGREIETMLPPGMLSIDYVTMQPMMEYYPKIYEARNSSQQPTTWWYSRLSAFSQMAVKNCIVALVLLLGWSLLSKGLNHKFGPKNYIVLLLTLLQSFVILAVIYWKHTKDVSIDALIKYFTVGLCLSTTSAIFFELVLGLIVRLSMAFLMAVSGIDVVQENGYTLFELGLANVLTAAQQVNYGGVNYREYLKAYGNDHPGIYTIYMFVVSFVLAAMIEEFCKYFGYRMVDHPDFYSQSEVDEAMKCYRERGEEEPSVTSFPNQNRSLRSRGAAITISMVAVGVGFACCENLVYIFIYGKAQHTSEILILLARSLLPIHPIAAALQSIGVCKRDLEKQKLGQGRIILSGVLFHGIFDFMLIWIDYIGNRKGNYVDEDDGIETEAGSDRISNVVSAFVLIFGLVYYIWERQKQRQRLSSMEVEHYVGDSYFT